MERSNYSIKNNKERYEWIDSIKLFACFLVVFGHLWMSLMSSGLLDENNFFYCWPIQTIYSFHVPLFFVCSGFLYQKKGEYNVWTIELHIRNIQKKLLSLGIPYFIFSSITLLFKNMFSNVVNNQATPFFKTLLFEPIAPYWYLYTLFLLFCIVPVISGKNKGKKIKMLVVTSFTIKVIYIIFLRNLGLPDLLNKIFGCLCWFCFGMFLSKYTFIKNRVNNYFVLIIFIMTICLSVYIYGKPIDDPLIQFCFALFFVIEFVYIFQSMKTDLFQNWISKLTKYFMPVYVLHTIIASSFRIILFKLGVTNLFIHTITGLFVSICIPMLIYEISLRKWWLLFLFEPQKGIKMKKESN